mmetsp:Transcript_128449/g.256586  ORF Transcript_128449/g.256586 Transcript_128449/m.256586 type:complete len:529 (+) Transcript_128449:41-1627(+)
MKKTAGAVSACWWRSSNLIMRHTRCSMQGAVVAAARVRTMSALATAVHDLRPRVLAACTGGHALQTISSKEHLEKPAQNDHWAAVNQQAATARSWPSHPLGLPERLALVENLLERNASGLLRESTALCELFRWLIQKPGLFAPSSDGTGQCAVVVTDGVIQYALYEAAALLLRGYVVTLMAPNGLALETLQEIACDFPPQLLQVSGMAPLASPPSAVRAIRFVGLDPPALWVEEGPPADCGTYITHGYTGAVAAPLRLVRSDLTMLEQSCHSTYAFNDQINDVAALLSTAHSSDTDTLPGLPLPRWARSAYDRGMEDVQKLLDLLWAFREPFETEGPSQETLTIASLLPVPKHFMISSGVSEIPEDIVKAAMVAALSPFNEPMVLHTVGMDARSLRLDPLHGLFRLLQSGNYGFEWHVHHHDSNRDCIEWLRSHAHAAKQFSAHHQIVHGPTLAFFGSHRGIMADVRKLSVSVGVVAWTRLFQGEVVEQLRRWTGLGVFQAPATEREVVARTISACLRDVKSAAILDD